MFGMTRRIIIALTNNELYVTKWNEMLMGQLGISL